MLTGENIMKLQDRDYNIILSEEEKRAYEAELVYEASKGPKNNREFPRFSHPDKKIREFIWHKRSLFPNNFLHFTEYKSEVNFETEANNFKDIIYLRVKSSIIKNNSSIWIYGIFKLAHLRRIQTPRKELFHV